MLVPTNSVMAPGTTIIISFVSVSGVVAADSGTIGLSFILMDSGKNKFVTPQPVSPMTAAEVAAFLAYMPSGASLPIGQVMEQASIPYLNRVFGITAGTHVV
jgi:hypothetical protein